MDWKTVMGGRRKGDFRFTPEELVKQKQEEWSAEEAERARIEKQEAEERACAFEELVEKNYIIEMRKFLYEQPLSPKNRQN